MVFMKYILTGILINLLMNGVAHASHHHDSESNKPSGDGHCAYMADNPFAGDPYRACRTNVSESFCKAFSEVGDGVVSILDPQYGAGDCPRESSIGLAKEVDGKKFITKIAIKVQWA
ncbi:MAG: hypothetical protein Ct9H90mP13_00530 [Pseudomonadota bacterium]|nr:MAG: hypothetical protein Ct9H90mP13_00530 [Pseudomonadota bacterium]